MRESIKKRTVQIESAEIPEGYAYTRVGIVPVDWKQSKLKKHIVEYTEKTTERNQYPVLTSSRKGLMLQSDYYSDQITTDDNIGYNIIPYGYITYRSRSDDGHFVFNENNFIDKGIISYYYPVFSFSKDVNHDFLFALLNYTSYRQAYAFVEGTAQLVLSMKKLGELKYYLPPIAEQEKIAEILNQCDKVIELKQQLIEEERNRKKWLMQSLLCNMQTYSKIKIGDLTEVCAGATPSTKVADYWGGDIRWMSSGELNYKRVYDVEGRITAQGLANSGTKLLPEKCVLVGLAGQGKTRGTVAVNYIPLCTNQSIAAILPSDKFEPEYLFWDLENRYKELRRLSSGDGARGGLNLDIIKNVAIHLPPLAEQQRIANILSAVDLKIYLLEQELAQWQQKKKALMQLLLTGIVRVSV